MLIRTAGILVALIGLLSNSLLIAAPEPRAVVSAASFARQLAPGSLITIFGTGLADTQTVAEIDENGDLPLSLGGVTVTINGSPAPLVFVSPLQINLYVPDETDIGDAIIDVAIGGESASIGVVFQEVAPGLFLLPCLRNDRGAVLNGVTFQFEPFAGETAENEGDDKRTRLSFFGTGIRNASPESVTVLATDRTGRTVVLAAEYAGPAYGYFGLDQINAVLPEDLDAAGLVYAQVRIGSVTSNRVSIVLGREIEASAAEQAAPAIVTVAGNGAAGYDGDGGPALEAALSLPYSAAFDAEGALYIADPGARVVRRIGSDGMISTFAGNGEPGAQGDGGPAIEASLLRPVAVAVGPGGDVYIADADDHRVRRVDTVGVIHAFAGSGAMGDAGHGGAALDALLHTPVGLAVNQFGSVYIADQGAHRVWKVFADGRIASIAGTGVAGGAGDGGAASAAKLNAPTGVAVGLDGALFIAEGGRGAVRRVEPHGTIRTLLGESGDSPGGPAQQGAAFGSVIALASDASGRLCIADSDNHRLQIVNESCAISTLAGVGSAGFSPDGVLASEAWLNSPSGVVVSPAGELHFADSENHLVRKMTQGSATEGESCTQHVELFFEPSVVVSGERAMGYVRISCPSPVDLEVLLTADRPGVPASVTIPAGQTTVSFVVDTSGVTEEVVTVHATAKTPDGEDDGTLTIVPPGDPGVVSLAVGANSVVGGNPVEASVRIGSPAPAGGLYVDLSVDKTEASPPAGVTIPEGRLAVEFLINTVQVDEIVLATVTGEAEGAAASDTFEILPLGGGGPGDDPDPDGDPEASIASLTVDPSSVTGGSTSTGTVNLTEPAPEGGVVVQLSSDSEEAETPGSLTIPQGEDSGQFTISTSVVDVEKQPVITAKASNSASDDLTITPATNPDGDPCVDKIGVSVSSILGGLSLQGFVRLTAAAGPGGVTVDLDSSLGPLSIPASVFIGEGEVEATFAILTQPVTAFVSAVITATTSGCSNKSVTLGIDLLCTKGLTLSVGSIVGGESLTGTVTLTGPAPEGGARVELVSSKAALQSPGSVLVPEGETSASFALSTAPVPTILAVTLEAIFGECPGVSARLEIQVNEILDPILDPDGDGDGVLDPVLDPDGDGDGVLDPILDPDGDGDGILDPILDPDGDGDGILDPILDPDGDGDGILDPILDPDGGGDGILDPLLGDGDGEGDGGGILGGLFP